MTDRSPHPDYVSALERELDASIADAQDLARRLAAIAELYVIAGPIDPEDGTLFWSNADGWGHLSTATVFTSDEYDDGRGNVPFGDNARWMRLPAR